MCHRRISERPLYDLSLPNRGDRIVAVQGICMVADHKRNNAKGDLVTFVLRVPRICELISVITSNLKSPRDCLKTYGYVGFNEAWMARAYTEM